jgi:hypothetical protein
MGSLSSVSTKLLSYLYVIGCFDGLTYYLLTRHPNLHRLEGVIVHATHTILAERSSMNCCSSIAIQ